MAENVFAASVEPQILSHFCSARFEKPDQAAVMVEMPVAEDQRIDPRRVDLHDLQVVGIGLGGEAKIQQIATCFHAPLGFDVQRQAPLAVERFARRSIGTSALHGKAGLFGAAQKDIVRAVGHLLHNDPVDRRHLDARSRGGRPTDPRGQQRAAHRSRGLEKTPPIQRRHAGLPVNYPLCARAREISSDIPDQADATVSLQGNRYRLAAPEGTRSTKAAIR